MDLLTSLARDSALFVDALHVAPSAARVPACPEWGAADLAFHLAEVQSFWADVVGPAPGEGQAGDDVQPLVRPASDEDLPALVEEATARLLAALDGRDPDEPCWSWHDGGHRVGWVVRRQAHEALIHRVDAQQTAGVPVVVSHGDVAADGIDEILGVMLDGVPSWGTFTPDGGSLAVVVDGPGEAHRSWDLAFGRVTGTGPESGKYYDLDAAQLVDLPGSTTAQVVGPAWDVDLWLWGRGPREPLTVHGDATLVDRLRSVAWEVTQ
ncbi:maleylpyruvate isomerase family mycothiol-dependent enzyme [Oerskovia flava]|uniref:maleylpyruvate isomerase family mycothiol-dependent enzyme n=1 Tax=Oerskovia flava TaxID=2986422 RepID=UPI00223ECB2F|nr:maleylpyruvate isomerase family mycothiol-dependent enzyme [Oerskovia sp. JB1-3-2]